MYMAFPKPEIIKIFIIYIILIIYYDTKSEHFFNVQFKYCTKCFDSATNK